MSETLHKKAVDKAIKFLQAAGASYIIEFGGEKFTNRKSRPDYKSVYGPLLDQAEKEGQTTVTIQVPAEFELEGFRSAVAGTLSQRFGPDSSMSEINKEAHTVTVLWIKD